jgi:transcription elongation GreA/GreB family factor
MTAPPIKKKDLEDVETEWNSRIQSSPRELTWFLEMASQMCAVKAQVKSVELMLLLAEALAADDAWEESFDVIANLLTLVPRNREAREKALEMVRERYAAREDLEEVVGIFEVVEAEDPARGFASLRDWLRFEKGAGFWLFGRGLGKVAEVNLGLQKVKIHFEKAAPLDVRADEAKRLLTYLPDEHFMMRRLEDAEAVTKEAKEDPGRIMRELLTAFGRPLTSAEIKECMVSVIDGGKWTSWWNRARQHPQVLPAKDLRNAFEWSDSAETAEQSLLDEFGSASFEGKLELARKHAKRGGAVEKGILEGLREELERVGPDGGAPAVEVACLYEDLGGKLDGLPVDVEAELNREDRAQIVAAVSERRFREKLYKRLRKVRKDDWADAFRDAFLAESDLRLMSWIYDTLVEHGPEGAAAKLVADSVSSPRQTPRPFVWVTKNAGSREELLPRANHALLSKIIDALDAPEFKEMRAPLREQFEEGGVAFIVFERSERDGVDHLLNLIDSAHALEEHRKTDIRRAIFRKYPDIRKRDDDAIFTTADSIEEKRKEFENLVKKEIPENAEAIRIAREYGDLRENFEYHAARQKHEVLNARAGRLHDDLRKARAVDPTAVNTARVGIGTRFELRPEGGGPVWPVTILGPWDSDPDSGIYSYLSDFAKELLGSGEGEKVTIEDQVYRIGDIRVWRQPQAAASRSME